MAKTIENSTVIKTNDAYYKKSNKESEISNVFPFILTKRKSFAFSLLTKTSKIQIALLFFLSFIFKTINSHVCGFDSYPHKKPQILQMQPNEDLVGEAENPSLESLLLLEESNSKDDLLNISNLEKKNFKTQNSNLNNSNILKGVKEEENKRFLQTSASTSSSLASSFTPIRIEFDFTTLDSQSASIDANVIAGVKKILADTQTIFQNILGVKRYNTKLRVRSCDQNIQISNLVKTGIDADLVIFPFFDSTLSNTSTEAYATACIISSIDSRPVAGLIGISPKFSVLKKNWELYYTNLALHELSHVIVFNPNLFEFFRDKSGNPYKANEVIKQSIVNGMQRTSLAYPKVLETAKKHFNCSSIYGVELENQGGAGTAASHWEARVMLGDYMIGLSFDDTAISEITLALFEDSGWYSVNYYTGGLFKYGKNKGCDFLNKKCIENNIPLSNDEFCVTPYQSLCVSNRLSRGICYITDSSNPDDDNYRYFAKASTGGLSMADFCPIIAVPTNSTYFYPWSCSDGLSTYPPEFDEAISNNSGCFISNTLRSSANARFFSNAFRATCFQFKCDFNNFVLSVTVGFQTVNCPTQGGQVTVPGYTGNLICPDFYKMCTNQAQCKDMMTCAINKVLPINAIYTYIPNTNQVPVNTNNASSVPTGTITNPPATSSVSAPFTPVIAAPPTTPASPIAPIAPIAPVTPIKPTNQPNMTLIIPSANITLNNTVKAPVNYNKTLTKDDSTTNAAFYYGNSFVSLALILFLSLVF